MAADPMRTLVLMWSPRPLGDTTDPFARDVANQAHNGHLTIYAGAGLSMGEPTDLPGARALAQRVVAELRGTVAFDGVDTTDLLAVADAVAATPAGDSLLRDTVLRVADLLGAHPNFGHRALALLLLEGAATVFETNYDDCIERAAQPERPHVVLSDKDLLHGQANALLKAHGCASRRDTMLTTSADLTRPPLWAAATVRSKLSQDRVLFVGIGSVADYVKKSVIDVLGVVGGRHLQIVDPALRDWETNGDLDWRRLFDERGVTVDASQRDERESSEFLDAVLRAYVQRELHDVRAMTAGLAAEHPQRVGAEAILSGLEHMDAARTLRWLRDATWHLCSGQKVVGAVSTTLGLLGLGALAGAAGGVAIDRGALLTVTPRTKPGDEDSQPVRLLPLLVRDAAVGAVAAREARVRVQRARMEGDLRGDEAVVVVVSGNIAGPLGLDEVVLERGEALDVLMRRAAEQLDVLPADLVDEGSSDHLIDGTSTGRMYIVDGSRIVDAA